MTNLDLYHLLPSSGSEDDETICGEIEDGGTMFASVFFGPEFEEALGSETFTTPGGRVVLICPECRRIALDVMREKRAE